MTFCILKGNIRRYNRTIYVEVETINEHTLANLKNELIHENIYGQLNKDVLEDPNVNCDILLNTIIKAKEKHMPKKRRKFNKRKHKIEKWMTDELLILVNRKNEMYVDWKTNSQTVQI